MILQLYNPQEVLQSKLDLLTETKMVDYAIDVFKKLHPDKEIPPVSFYLIHQKIIRIKGLFLLICCCYTFTEIHGETNKSCRRVQSCSRKF